MKSFITIATIVCFWIIIANNVIAAPEPAEILADTASAYTFAKDWLKDLVLPILGFLAFTGVISFWLKSAR